MRELSIFVDESGDLGQYDIKSPFYIISLVFHNQENDISNAISKLEEHLLEKNMPKDHCFHVGPMIRKEEDYENLLIEERRNLLFSLISFVKHVKISYKTFIVEKKNFQDREGILVYLTKQLSSFIQENKSFFNSYERVVLYYDYGQAELGRLLLTVFTALISNFEYKKVMPSSYRLFQVADLLCTIELIIKKKEKNNLTKWEREFFYDDRAFKTTIYRPIKKLEFKWNND